MKKLLNIILPCFIFFNMSTYCFANSDNKELDILESYQNKFFINIDDKTIDKEFANTSSLIKKTGFEIKPEHLFIIVDRGVRQLLIIVYPKTLEDWEVVQVSHVSTGKPGRKEHFKTPIGVFHYDGQILGYRAEGTYNKNHIRGIGLKGSRVWDFGWQTTEDWRTHTPTMQIRMEMHATDPANLEFRLGRPDSEGCVRIPSGMNHFLDVYGILDEYPNQMAINGDKRWSSLLGKEHHYLAISGSDFIIVDTDK